MTGRVITRQTAVIKDWCMIAENYAGGERDELLAGHLLSA
jgi:hypothetical protein